MLEQIINSLWIVLAGGVVLALPGLAWQAWFPRRDNDFLQGLGDAVGLSVAITALLALAAFLLKVRLFGTAVAGFYLLLAAATIAGCLWRWPSWRLSWGLAAGLALLAGLIAWRLYQARALVLPAWVNSLHHVLIVRKMLEYGGLPPDLQPYLPVAFYYHYAFHVITAAFAFLTGLSPDRAVLLFGQALNALVCVSIYRLVMAVWSDWRKAALAALLAGFFSQMPAYYLTWGRYTLLAGLLVLPLAMSAALDVSRHPARKENVARLAVLTAGVALAHYLALFILAIFLAALGLQHISTGLRERRFDRPLWAAFSLGSLGGLALAGPWLLRVFQYSNQSTQVSLDLPLGSAAQSTAAYAGYLWSLLGPRHNYFLLLLGGVGLLFALRRPAARPLALWSALLVLLTLPWTLRLGPFRPDHFAIVLFLPAVLFAADLLASAGEALGQVGGRAWGGIALAALALGLCLWGARETQDIVNPVTVFTDQADLDALNWIRDNTPPDARFFINTTPWQGSVYRGVDGGAWILPYTGRWSLVPTVFYGFGDAALVKQDSSLGAQASAITTCDAKFWKLVEETGIDYIYIKQGVGGLQAGGLAGCTQLSKEYDAGGVSIYRFQSAE